MGEGRRRGGEGDDTLSAADTNGNLAGIDEGLLHFELGHVSIKLLKACAVVRPDEQNVVLARQNVLQIRLQKFVPFGLRLG